MSTHNTLSRFLEGAVNRYLKLDEDLASALSELAGSVVALEVEGTGVHLSFAFAGTGVIVRPVEDEQTPAADVQVRGTPFALLRLVREEGSDPTLGGQVRIHGDIDVAQRLSRVLHRFDFDWEELLSQVTGDVAAHQAGRAVRGAGAVATRVRETLETDLGEYLVEESGLLPGRTEIEDFVAAVDDLRDDAARLDKRLQRLVGRRAGDGSA